MGRSVGHGLGWLEFFEEVPEPRQKAKVLYPLSELLLCCLVGVLCGAEGWVEVEEYGEAKLDFLRRFLPFAHGIASHDTFSDVFNALDAERFKVAFIAWAAALQENVREIVAIDGKTLRRSFVRGGGQGPIHMISAWAAGQRLVLGRLAVGAKDNEITAIPELLALLSLKGAIVTIDAIGCQKKIAAVIRDRGADYLLALKDNQPTLHRDVADFLIEQRATGFTRHAATALSSKQSVSRPRGTNAGLYVDQFRLPRGAQMVTLTLGPKAIRECRIREDTMAVARVSKITAASSKSFDAAVQEGLARASKTLRGITGLHVIEQKASVAKGKIAEYRVTMEVMFLLED